MSKALIDVRTTGEFNQGNVRGSINIPLQEIQLRLEEIRQIPQPFILCCATGNRSSQAAQFLQSIGIDCENGGSWMAVNK